MKIWILEDFYGKNYYFDSLLSLKTNFLHNGELLLKAVDNCKIVEMSEYDLEDISKIENNYVQGITRNDNVNLRDCNNFQTLKTSQNFKNILDEFIENLKLTEDKIDHLVIYALKKKILPKTRLLPRLIHALEVDDSILKYFLIMRIRGNN